MKDRTEKADMSPEGSTSQNDGLKWLEHVQFVVEAAMKDSENRLAPVYDKLVARLRESGVYIPAIVNTPYVNTISAEDEPAYPGDRDIERRIKSYIRWNAMAMVVNANHAKSGIGGHISTYASCATLYEVGFNHFFRAATDDHPADMIYFQGHASPGIYARAFLEHRIDQDHLHNFRQELAEGGGLSSYPHPYLMPEFWQFPTVSMGLGPIMSIYQARFNRYLRARGFVDGEEERVWCFLGDGETDEPESLGSLTLPAREGLDNLIWVVNCNLQRLDGPVRGNGKIIQQGVRGLQGVSASTSKNRRSLPRVSLRPKPYFVGTRWMGLQSSVRTSLAHTAETVGIAVVFFIANATVLVVGALTMRALGVFVSLYLATDLMLVILSSIQAVVFQFWRYSDESDEG